MRIPSPCAVFGAFLGVLALASSLRAQCTAAENLTVEARTCSVRLTWTRQAGTPAPSAWQIFRNTTNSLTGATQVGTVAGTVQQFDAVVSDPTRSFLYFVRPLVTGCPNPPSAFVPATARPQVVVNLQASAISCGQIRISWDAFPDATQYRVLRSTGGFAPEDLGAVQPTFTTFTDTTGVPLTPYQYTVLVSTACLASTTGSQVSATFPGAPAPEFRLGPLVVQAGNSGGFNLRMLGEEPQFNPTYRWFKDGQLLTLGGRITSSGTSLLFDPFKIQDVGFYSVELTTTCGVGTQSMLVAVRPQPCPADFNQSGTVSVQDVFDFLTAFFSGCN